MRRIEKQEQIKRLASFPEINPNPVMEVDSLGNIYYLNRTAKKIFPNITSLKKEHPYLTNLDFVFNKLRRNKKKIFNREVKIGDFWYHQTLFYIEEIKHFRIYGYDVTQMKKNEEALKENDKMLNKTQEISHLGTWAHDMVNGNTYWSDETYRIYGYKPREVISSGKNFNHVVHPDDRKQVADIYLNSTKEGKDGYVNTFRILKNSTGELRTVYEKCEHIRDSSGKMVRSIGMVQDITERKIAEEKLNKFSQAVEQSLASIVITGLDGNIEYVNQGFVNTTGYSREEALGKNPRILKSGLTSKKIYQALWKTITSGKEWKGELCNKKKNGDLYWEQVSISPIKNTEEKVTNYLAVKNDITELKNLDQRKDEFITIAGHELRTPISAIRLTNQILQQTLAKNPQALKYLEKIERQSNIQVNLINDLLNVSRIQTGKLEIRKEKFNLEDLIKEVIETMQKTTTKHKISIKGKLPDKIYTDRERISQVLTNFCSNAIKYSPNGKKIIVELKKTDKETVVSVTDYGIGIPKENYHGIFKRFYRVYGDGNEGYPGLGMGLYISYQIIGLLNGRMWFDSEPKKGSTFYFSLPL